MRKIVLLMLILIYTINAEEKKNPIFIKMEKQKLINKKEKIPKELRKKISELTEMMKENDIERIEIKIDEKKNIKVGYIIIEKNRKK